MKNILKSIVVALVGITMAMGLNSCEREGAEIGQRQIVTQEGDTLTVKVREPAVQLEHVRYNGHDYLEANFGTRTQTPIYSLMHDPDCRAFKCK